MTDEDRKKLIEDLLLMSDVKHYGPLYRRAAEEIENLDAARLNNEYQRDTALAELKDANLRVEGLARRVEQYMAALKRR